MIHEYISTLSYMGRRTVIAVGTVAGFALGIATTLTEDHIALIILIVSGMTAVVGGLTWIDARIEKKIREHSHEDKLRHMAVLQEIEHIHDILIDKLHLPPRHATPNPMMEDSRP